MVNPDLRVDWDAVKRQDDLDCIQKSVNNVYNTQLLYLKVNTVLTTLYKDEKLAKARLYQGAITRFLLENIKEEALNNEETLRNIVNIYYRILTDQNVRITDYLFLERYTKEYSSEIKSYLENKYQESKNNLLGCADLFELDQLSDDTDEMLKQIMTKYEDRSYLGRLYQKVVEKCRQFGDSSDRVVAAQIKRIKDSYETIVVLKNNVVYRIKSENELKRLHF